MKIRAGFVSNSSSSSFICELTGRVEEGYDLGLEDANMVVCGGCGCTFSRDLALPGFEESETAQDDLYAIPSEFCPICAGHDVPDVAIIKYMSKKYEVKTRKDLWAKLRQEDPNLTYKEAMKK
jgi:hypothetical protein